MSSENSIERTHIATGFDRLAPFYKFISNVFFGRSLLRAQEHYLSTLKPGDSVLILGGGNGELLPSLLRQQTKLTVDYIDISPGMISLAKKKAPEFYNVNFIVGTEQDIPAQPYSVVITNFYLDLFPEQKLSQVIQTIKKHLAPGATWLVTDFVQEKRWHQTMLWVMYRFFNLVTHIEARSLPDWQSVLKEEGITETESKRFYHGFIQATVYKKLT